MQQAECAHSAPETCASSGNVNETSATTRRGLIGLFAAASAVSVAMPALAAASSSLEAHRSDVRAGAIAAAAPAPNTSAWNSAMRELLRAEAAYEADKRLFEPLAEKWRAGRPAGDMVDWSALLDGRRSAVRSYDLDAAEATTRRQIERGYFRGGRLEELARRRLAAYDQVRAFRIAEEANDELHNFGSASDRNAKLAETVSDLEDVLVAMPAPNVTALLWKMERLIFDEDGGVSPWTFSYVEPMMRDARRLLGAEA